MTFELLLFWVTLFLCFELFWVSSAAYFIATLLACILAVVAFLFWVEFDMLASLLFGVYSSVFIVFFLLLLHFATFWAAAVRQQRGGQLFVFLGVAGCFLWGTVLCGGFDSNLSLDWSLGYLWQDFFSLTGLTSSMTVQLLHFFFFRFFVFETLLLNLYLFFGLMLALCLLSVFRAYGEQAVVSRETGAYKPASLSSKLSVTSPASMRVRQVSKFRRQARRQNSSVLKHR